MSETVASGLRGAIDRRCRDCAFDELAPGKWRQQVARCEITSCPLHAVRPVPRGGLR